MMAGNNTPAELQNNSPCRIRDDERHTAKAPMQCVIEEYDTVPANEEQCRCGRHCRLDSKANRTRQGTTTMPWQNESGFSV